MGKRKYNRVLSSAAAAVIEGIEGRRLLSASLELQGGVLTVTGTPGSDALIIDETAGYTRAELQKPDGSGASAYYFQPVTAIRFDSAGGSDSLIVRRDGSAAAIRVTTRGPAGQAVVTDDGGYQIIDGVLGGSGNQQRPTATVIDGILRVAGTDAADEMNVGISTDGAHVFVRVNAAEYTFDLAGITGVEMDGGAGNDSLAVDNYHGALHLPVTLLGGAGNDLLAGPSGRGHCDDITIDLNNPGDMPTTLVGGEGDDTLCGGLDTDRLEGGAGADVFRAGAEDVVSDPDVADDGAIDTGQGGNELPIISNNGGVYVASAPTPGLFGTHRVADDADSILA